VDHGRHEAQHAPGPLELHQGGPVVVEPVENFRVDGVGRPDALLVVRLAAVRRELLVLGAIEVVEGPRHRIARHEILLVHDRFEKPSADNLEPFLGARRPPGGLHAPDHVAQTVQGLPSPLASDLGIVGLRMRRARRVRGGKADHEQALLRQFGRFGQNLRKGKLGLEAPRGQVALVMELPGVGDPFVNQDETWPVVVEE